jgi:hypothetical protein
MLERMRWGLGLGERVKRTELHAKYGGRRQGGIAPSTVSPNVLIFTAPAGQKYGYFDGRQPDGCFHYTGEGQIGDQQLKQGNRALFDHVQTGKSVRLFKGARGQVFYVGEFQVDQERPYYTTDAPDVNGEIREVIVFRLRPIGEIKGDLLPVAEEALQEKRTSVSEIDPESRAAEQFTSGAIEERVAERREAALITAYLEFRRASGLSKLQRLKIKPVGEVQPLYTDLYDPETKLVIEAKGTVTREVIRMAIGQLLDYSRFVDHAKLAVLLPEVPRRDLLDLLHKHSIVVIAPQSDGHFEVTAEGTAPRKSEGGESTRPRNPAEAAAHRRRGD